MKATRPAVSPHDWIDIGAFEAVICQVLRNPEMFEVVYLDDGQPISNVIEWTNEGWRLVQKSGGYARNKAHLDPYVTTLRAGRYRA